MDTGARATQEQLPVGRLSPCPLGVRVENMHLQVAWVYIEVVS